MANFKSIRYDNDTGIDNINTRINSINTSLDTKMPKSGGTFTGQVNCGSLPPKFTMPTSPADNDACNVSYTTSKITSDISTEALATYKKKPVTVTTASASNNTYIGNNSLANGFSFMYADCSIDEYACYFYGYVAYMYLKFNLTSELTAGNLRNIAKIGANLIPYRNVVCPFTYTDQGIVAGRVLIEPVSGAGRISLRSNINVPTTKTLEFSTTYFVTAYIHP
jgi:hypothetical protein